MKRSLLALALSVLPALASAGDLTVDHPMVPLAPPGSMAHAAFFTITNTGDTSRSLIGVTAPGYHMAHIHQSEEINGVATMQAMHQVDIAPGQSVTFEHGGLHIMLMHPAAPLAEGAEVPLELKFANGETLFVTATVMRMMHGSS